MTLHIPFDNSFARLPENLFSRTVPTPVSTSRLLAFNDGLAEELGIARADDDAMAEIFAGNRVPDGAEPIAQVYAGHQFGTFNPQLGDGRAILLGEVVDRAGQRRDIQLKGSGRTPFSRMGDGRAWMGPVLREYVVSEAMHALGIPTTRALAAVATGEQILREQGPMPGAVLTRVAASHIRVGTFQYFAARDDRDSLRALTDYAIARHAPKAEGPLGLLESVIARQSQLVAKWMGVGFIHGVMNTDNTSISGETIDYGPCAFMDGFHPARTFSSIDRGGRYAYENQPDILVWNMAQLATALLVLEDDRDSALEGYTRAVHGMADQIRTAWEQVFCAKLGIAEPQDGDARLVTDLLTLMANQDADFTNTFRSLSEGTLREQFTDPAALDAWHELWQSRIKGEDAPIERMRAANPAVIPRNHRIEAMIEAAVEGDMAPFHALMSALQSPYTDPDDPALASAPTPEEEIEATFCGT
ncbi:Uncharacterized conserved protein YdiU, UPF0061 family [Poseidonocella pacifica]|uniref:Protein nucleotidyltransferase YdiU n=1 Tax=Poseidonocella pacifica TaxID=871651 RepID=A0A1I0VHU3_9RHOB|nr:YdiU family protein [Poseidonocella pacifica]SFA75882.1 Uncharacterized conserved protein YdiU, UPF0061 family [Poseidonocella pacifica]